MIASASLSIALATFLSLSAGTNSQLLRRRGHAGFLASKAVRRQRATSSPRWLKLLCSKVTIPALGRDLDSRERRHFGFAAQRVADEHRGGECQLVVAEVGDERAQGGVADADPDHQPEGEDRIDQRPAEFRGGGDFMVEVQRLGIVGQRRDEDIVGLGDGAGDGMGDACRRPAIRRRSVRAWRRSKRQVRRCHAPSRSCPCRRCSGSAAPSARTCRCAGPRRSDRDERVTAATWPSNWPTMSIVWSATEWRMTTALSSDSSSPIASSIRRAYSSSSARRTLSSSSVGISAAGIGGGSRRIERRRFARARCSAWIASQRGLRRLQMRRRAVI